MVAASIIQASNKCIANSLPSGLVAVFVGGTNGIGEYTLKQFAKYTKEPRIYFVGRSQDAADCIIATCKRFNSEGTYIFMKADVGSIHTVDTVCSEIKEKEKAINLLFLTPGTLVGGTKTSEDLHLAATLITYSRNRFAMNLMPLLQRATGLRRVVSVFCGGKEGDVDTNDFQALTANLMSMRGHAASLVTLSLEALARTAPEVSFIHDFPGPVKSGIARGTTGLLGLTMRVIPAILGPFMRIPEDESGERHLFLATSARYPAAAETKTPSSPILGVAYPSDQPDPVARGSNGTIGSGVYVLDQNCDPAGPAVEKILLRLRTEGVEEKFWTHQQAEFARIGVASLPPLQ